MILDTSAIVAILYGEPEADEFVKHIENAVRCCVSAGTYVEAAIVIDRNRDPIVSRRFDDLIREANIIIEPLTEVQAKIAREAYRDFGKRSGHPARLNYGDCFAYALAQERGEPLLFKGDDFSRTDVRSALQ